MDTKREEDSIETSESRTDIQDIKRKSLPSFLNAKSDQHCVDKDLRAGGSMKFLFG